MVGVDGGEAVTRRQGFDHHAQQRLVELTLLVWSFITVTVSKGFKGLKAYPKHFNGQEKH